MNPEFPLILGVAGIVLVVLVFVAVWASRYVRVGPNRVLIVSGRLRRLADGTSVGYRIVKGGGTFVIPVVEKAEALSLEVLSIEMPKLRVQTAKGVPVEADCLAQVKIKSDDASILAAAEHFLSKNEAELRDILRPILDKHLRNVLGSLSAEELDREREACAARVQNAAGVDLGKMGVGIVTFTIRQVRAG